MANATQPPGGLLFKTSDLLLGKQNNNSVRNKSEGHTGFSTWLGKIKQWEKKSCQSVNIQELKEEHVENSLIG